MNSHVHQRIRGSFYDTYFEGSVIRRISFYVDRRPMGALLVLKNLKAFVQLTVKERKSLAFLVFTFQFRVLQFVAFQQEIIERAEFLPRFLNLQEEDGGKMLKIECRFDKEVISSEWMDTINRVFQCLLETGHLGQMPFSELQVRVSILSLIMNS